MMKYHLPLLLALHVGLVAAQPATIPPPSLVTQNAADAQWQQLKSFGRPSSSPNVGKKATRSEEAARFVNQANQLKNFYTAYPNHISAKEAKVREVVALALGELNGEASQGARRQTLLGEIRKDTSIPLARRFEAVAWSSRAANNSRGSPDRAAKIAAEEKLTRDLIAEFPAHPVGYESLVALARDSAPERGKSMAREILNMATASLEVKAEAQRIIDRQALVGRSFRSILQQAGAVSMMPGGSPKVTLLYSWSISMPQSRLIAKRFAQQAPQGGFIGICLDTNLKDATQAASSNKLPGQQYYHARGALSPLAEALSIGLEAVVYVVDHDGIIRDVQGNIDLSEKVARLSK